MPSIPWLKAAVVLTIPLAGFQAAADLPVFLRTGSGSVVTSELSLLNPLPGSAPGLLNFEFGYSTDELLQPGSFADSFTISLENALGQRIYLVTADAGGNLWAPFVPGAVPVADSAIFRETVSFAVPGEALDTSVAYRVGLNVPDDWANQPLKLRFDLFDNQDAIPSAAYFQGVALVPEPSSLLLLAGGVAALLFLRRR